MNTYEYYKDQTSRPLFDHRGNVGRLSVEKGKVQVEGYGGNLPGPVQKGIWSVKPGAGFNRYTPQGDPDYDPTGEQMAWGKTIAPKDITSGKVKSDVYSRKIIDQSKKFWGI